jgi:hypothetical protein
MSWCTVRHKTGSGWCLLFRLADRSHAATAPCYRNLGHEEATVSGAATSPAFQIQWVVGLQDCHNAARFVRMGVLKRIMANEDLRCSATGPSRMPVSKLERNESPKTLIVSPRPRDFHRGIDGNTGFTRWCEILTEIDWVYVDNSELCVSRNSRLRNPGHLHFGIST